MQYWGLSDPGMVRRQNQDAYQVVQLDRNTLLGVVCDGMGGAKSGNIASSLAVDVFVEESPLKPSSKAAVAKFQKILEDGGITATVRRTLGGDIDASCGQLRRKYNKEKAE